MSGLTAASEALLARMMAETIAVSDIIEWAPNGLEDKALAHIETIRAAAIARVLDADRVAAALHKALGHGYHGGGRDHGDGDLADRFLAALTGDQG